jgi:YbgC/YbaW family acyl-CoA thioester hydrolase
MPPAEPFWFHVRVQFDRTDAQARVFYAHYFPLIDQARCAFWEGIGLTPQHVRQIELETVIVHVEADYLGPAEFYDLLRIYVVAEELGRSSLLLAYRVVNERTQQDIFTARMIMVQVDLMVEKSRPWSAAFRDAIVRHHGPQVVKNTV